MKDDHSPIETAIDIVRQKTYPPSSRLNAILYMVEKFEPSCLPVLEEVLHDPDEHPEVRSGAALALGKLGGDKVLELLKNMAQHEDDIIKSNALHALGMTESEAAVPTLLDALSSENNDVVASAAEALGRIGRPVVPHLIKLLSSGNAEDARCIAAWQLGTLRYRDAVTPLVGVVRNDSNPELVALCIWALGEIGEGTEDVMGALDWGKGQEDPAISRRAELAIKKIARHVN